MNSGDLEPIFGGEEIPGVPNGKLYFRFSHERKKEFGAKLSNGEVTYKVSEFVKADPLGIGGKVDVGDIFSAGTVVIRPVLDSEKES